MGGWAPRIGAQRHNHSTAVRARVESIAKELKATGRIGDPKRAKLEESRRAVLEQWKTVADILDGQGEITLAGDVRHFANQLPPVRTDREQLAARFIDYVRSTAAGRAQGDAKPGRESPVL